MKLFELSRSVASMVASGYGDLEVVIHSGGEDGFGYSPIEEIAVSMAKEDVGIDGPYRLDSEGDKKVVFFGI